MSEPEVKFEIDEHGRIGYRVTNEGVLLSKDEKEFIIDHVTRMQAENAKLREQMERLVTLLRVDCDIEASWDGLRKFWSIELTEGGCLMRDRACKAEAENAKLQKVCKMMHEHIKDNCDVCDEYYCSSWDEDNECCVFDTYMRELGVEVNDG